MQRQKRRQYTEACKCEAVRLVTDHGYGVSEAARNLGMQVTMLGRWKRHAEAQPNGHFGGNGHMSAAHEEILRWRKEVKRLRMERKI